VPGTGRTLGVKEEGNASATVMGAVRSLNRRAVELNRNRGIECLLGARNVRRCHR
jgi:hypothetical protein